ncbi:hypothetical protein CA13_72730 [Planctomycetes bacterium CA13]|uniref:Uncharacterized protein n=1 Tax=Novipirellula herctigrandis TaxID=2527986 RepID=A0A5C5YPD7_9BACT|nr:hypothetical protein CA13_72730 [Planctomycetes bacterium CA13]
MPLQVLLQLLLLQLLLWVLLRPGLLPMIVVENNPQSKSNVAPVAVFCDRGAA